MTIGIGELILRLATSVLLGSAIGYEREMRERPAGLRTHLLVSLASATFMLISSQLSMSGSRATTSKRRWSRFSRDFPASRKFACAGPGYDGTNAVPCDLGTSRVHFAIR